MYLTPPWANPIIESQTESSQHAVRLSVIIYRYLCTCTLCTLGKSFKDAVHADQLHTLWCTYIHVSMFSACTCVMCRLKAYTRVCAWQKARHCSSSICKLFTTHFLCWETGIDSPCPVKSFCTSRLRYDTQRLRYNKNACIIFTLTTNTTESPAAVAY